MYSLLKRFLEIHRWVGSLYHVYMLCNVNFRNPYSSRIEDATMLRLFFRIIPKLIAFNKKSGISFSVERNRSLYLGKERMCDLLRSCRRCLLIDQDPLSMNKTKTTQKAQ